MIVGEKDDEVGKDGEDHAQGQAVTEADEPKGPRAQRLFGGEIVEREVPRPGFAALNPRQALNRSLRACCAARRSRLNR